MHTRAFALAVAIAISSTLAACATSDTPTPAAVSAPTPPPAHAIPTAPARTAAQIKMDELLDEPQKAAIFKKHAPELAGNSQISMARGMTLADVAGYAEAGLTPAVVKAIVDDVNRL
jgi:hypothetical protein